MRKNRWILIFLLVLALGGFRLTVASTAFTPSSMAFQGWLAPYVPTPQDVVERILALAEVTSSDFVYDLGCGDGRIVIAAAKKYGARGVGVDIDPQRVAESRENARKEGVENLVSFLQQDALAVDLSGATVVTLYLLPDANRKLRPVLVRQLQPGARIVSHQYGMDDWAPLKEETFKDKSGRIRTLFLWQIDDRIRD